MGCDCRSRRRSWSSRLGRRKSSFTISIKLYFVLAIQYAVARGLRVLAIGELKEHAVFSGPSECLRRYRRSKEESLSISRSRVVGRLSRKRGSHQRCSTSDRRRSASSNYCCWRCKFVLPTLERLTYNFHGPAKAIQSSPNVLALDGHFSSCWHAGTRRAFERSCCPFDCKGHELCYLLLFDVIPNFFLQSLNIVGSAIG